MKKGISLFDMHSKLESDTPDNKKTISVKAVLNNDRALNTGPFNTLNLLVDASTHAVSGQSENKRNEITYFNFIR